MKQKIIEPKLYPIGRDLNKTWYVGYNDLFGKPLKRYGNLLNLKTVEERLQEGERIISEIKKEQLTNSATSLNGELVRYLDVALDARCQGKNEKTKYSYTHKIKKFCEWYRQASCPPINHLMGAAFLTWVPRNSNANSNTSINGYRRQLKTIFNDLIEFEYITVNPFAKTKKLSERTSTKLWFNKIQQKQLKDIIIENGDYQLWVMCMIQFYCFIRPGAEMRNLKIEDIVIFPDRMKIKVQSSSSKTGKERMKPIPAELKDILLPYIEGYEKSFYLFSKNGIPGNTMVGHNFFYKRHSMYMRILELGLGYSLYSWKNTGAVMMYKEGMKMKYISFLMGHTSIETTDEYFKSLGIDDVMDEVNSKYPVI